MLVFALPLNPSRVFAKGNKPPPASGEQKKIEPDGTEAPVINEVSPQPGAGKEGKAGLETENTEPAEESKNAVSTGARPTHQEEVGAVPESAPLQEQAPVRLEPPATVVEEAPTVIPEGSIVHTVWIWQETGDCLWMLAKKYYGDPWKWKKIYIANRSAILDPGVIFPKQQIIIPKLEQ